jgi:hypothetical protein
MYHVTLPRHFVSVVLRTPKVDTPAQRVFLAPIRNVMADLEDEVCVCWQPYAHTNWVQYLSDIVLDVSKRKLWPAARAAILAKLADPLAVVVITAEIHSRDNGDYVMQGKTILDIQSVRRCDTARGTR